MAAFRAAYRTKSVDASPEKVFSVTAAVNSTNNRINKMGDWDQVPGNVSHTGAYAPTAEYMEMFPWADGRNFDITGIYNNDNPNNIQIFENRDPRLYETLVVQKQGFQFQGANIQMWPQGNTRAFMDGFVGYMAHGMALYKWVLDYWRIADEPVQWPYLRMGELHLIYAEALAETGDLQKACDEVNKVRDRVGLPKIETSNPQLQLTTNKDNLIKEILRERACELGMEDTRLHDMVRRKLSGDFTKQLHGIRILRKDGATGDAAKVDNPYPILRYERYEITNQARAWWRPGFWTNKWFLSAMPIPEINKDYGLTQNPGW
jgi:hypothetical protein